MQCSPAQWLDEDRGRVTNGVVLGSKSWVRNPDQRYSWLSWGWNWQTGGGLLIRIWKLLDGGCLTIRILNPETIVDRYCTPSSPSLLEAFKSLGLCEGRSPPSPRYPNNPLVLPLNWIIPLLPRRGTTVEASNCHPMVTPPPLGLTHPWVYPATTHRGEGPAQIGTKSCKCLPQCQLLSLMLQYSGRLILWIDLILWPPFSISDNEWRIIVKDHYIWFCTQMMVPLANPAWLRDKLENQLSAVQWVVIKSE